ncbi:MAG: GNAT family N-acetyltransferase [Rhizobiaceae bacterium]|nr:GNAT family N-acetyltransferase [Rhizobiaceae bacterium]
MPADATAPAANLTLKPFDKSAHDRSKFNCGFEPIDNFLKSSLTDQIKTGMVTAWIATAGDDPAVLGFYTLGAMAVRSEFGLAKWQRARVPDVPVIYIRAVAVRKYMQGKGLGNALVIDAMRRCVSISEQMGAAAIVLDVLEDDAFDKRWAFYADFGFEPPGDPDNKHRGFISMADARFTLEGIAKLSKAK